MNGENTKNTENEQFIESFNRMSKLSNECSNAHGFWDNNPSDSEKIALMHSELSECLEGLRKDNPPDDKVPKFSSAEAELADLIIRTMDFAYQRSFRLGEVILAKYQYNLGRPYKHGKKF